MNGTYYQSNQNQIQNKSKTLNGVGATVYATAVGILSVLSVLCLHTDAQNVVFTFFYPFLAFAAGYFASALLMHSKNTHVCVCAPTALICCMLLCGDILRSLSVLGIFGVGLAMKYSTDKKRFTQSGIILIATSIYALTAIYVFCVLCYQKYGSIGTDSFLRAYESFTNLIMKAPTETLEQMKLLYTDEQYADLISSYASTVSLLRETLSLTVYFVPSSFLSICALGAFITVRGVVRHRRMQLLPDTVGEFSLTVVTAILYLIIYFVSIFTAADSSIGITLTTVGAVARLGLSLYGFYYIYGAIKLSEKRKLYTALLVVALLFFTSLAQNVLALFGSYRTVFLYKMAKDKEKGDGDQF